MSRPYQQRSPLISVHRTRRPCPVCGHRDNCAVSENGTYCRRMRSDRQGRDGGWWHPNDNYSAPKSSTPHETSVIKRKLTAPSVDRHVRDAVYQALLRSLPLLTPHRENLRARGLDEIAIARGKFKSTPTEEEAERIVASLAEDCDLAGIAGFYKDERGWRQVKTPSGFFVPVLDRQGLIQGLQIRRDVLRHQKDPRYMWFSSNPEHFPRGTSSGAPSHVQNPERIATTGRVLIIEGALKSFVAAQYLLPEEGGLLALAGTSAFDESLGQQLRCVWPCLDMAIICFDADWSDKREVKGQLRRLARSLKAASLSIQVRTWEYGKGIDDYLAIEAREAQEVAVA
jgi:DNA primase